MADPTRDELADRAAELDVAGRSSMDKEALAAAVSEAEAQLAAATREAEERARNAPPPAPPDDPDDGRPPLAQVAQEQAENAYVRVIGGEER